MNKVLNKGSSGKAEEKKSKDRDASADKRHREEVGQNITMYTPGPRSTGLVDCV